MREPPPPPHALERALGFAHHVVHDLPGRGQLGDGAHALAAGHELVGRVDLGAVGCAEVVHARLSAREHLHRERLQLLGVLLVVVRPVGAHDAARLAGVGLADDGAVLGQPEHGLLVAGHGAGLGGGDEASSDPHPVGAERERRGQPAPVEQAACGDDRQLRSDGIDHLGDEGHRGHRPRVAAAFGALGDDEIDSAGGRGDGVAHLAAHAADEDVVAVELVDHLAGDAEAGDEDARPTVDDGLDAFLHLTRQRGEQIDTERLRGEGLDLGDLLAEFIGLHRARAERADAAGLADRRDETVVTHPAHAGEHHRVFDVQQFGESSAQCHAQDGSPAPPRLSYRGRGLRGFP